MTSIDHTTGWADRWKGFLAGAIDRPSSVITTAELRRAGFHPQQIARLAQQGEIEAVQRGVYALQALGGAALSHHGRVLELQQRFPGTVLCLMSAASWHGLTSEEPLLVDLALPRDTTGHLPAAEGARFHWMTARVFGEGQQMDFSQGVPVRVFSPAKTVADLCRRRERWGTETYLGALKAYLIRGGADGQPGTIVPLLEAARVCRVERLIRHDLTVLQA